MVGASPVTEEVALPTVGFLMLEKRALGGHFGTARRMVYRREKAERGRRLDPAGGASALVVLGMLGNVDGRPAIFAAECQPLKQPERDQQRKAGRKGEGREEILGGGLGNEVTFTTRTIVGEPIGSFFGYLNALRNEGLAKLVACPKLVTIFISRTGA